MKEEKNNYKIKLCNYYKNDKCKKTKDECNYAHGKDDLRKIFKKDCVNGLDCFKKDCPFIHPDNWNYKINNKICEFFKYNNCINDNNCNFMHINEDDIINKVNEKNKTIDINSDNEFQFFENTNEDEKIKNEYISEEDNIKVSIDVTEYNNDILNNNINELKEKEINKKDDIEKIEDLILKLENEFKKYIKEIKHNIDNIYIEDKRKYGIKMKMDLNKITSNIFLLKKNFQDIN